MSQSLKNKWGSDDVGGWEESCRQRARVYRGAGVQSRVPCLKKCG